MWLFVFYFMLMLLGKIVGQIKFFSLDRASGLGEGSKSEENCIYYHRYEQWIINFLEYSHFQHTCSSEFFISQSTFKAFIGIVWSFTILKKLYLNDALA